MFSSRIVGVSSFFIRSFVGLSPRKVGVWREFFGDRRCALILRRFSPRLDAFGAIPLLHLLACALLLVGGFGAPMGDDEEPNIPWVGNDPAHLTTPSLRNVGNSLLQGAVLDVGRNNVTSRATNGPEQHMIITQKGSVLAASAISPGGPESKTIVENGNMLTIARCAGDRPHSPTFRRGRMFPNRRDLAPIRFIHAPTTEQVKGVGRFSGEPL